MRLGSTASEAYDEISKEAVESPENATQMPHRIVVGHLGDVINANLSTQSNQSKATTHQKKAASGEENQAETLYMKQHFDQLTADLAGSQSERNTMVQRLHWLEADLKRIDPAEPSAFAEEKRALPPFQPQPKRGGGSKPNRILEAPFRRELRRRMGLGSKDPLPHFEANPPSLYGVPVLRIDWSKPATAYAGLVQEIVTRITERDASARQRVEELGGLRAAIDVCLASLSRLIKEWHQQQRDAINPDRRHARDASRRRNTRVKKKCDKRTAALLRDDTLRRRYHYTNFTIPQAASVEATDVEATNDSDNEAETKSLEPSIGRINRLAGVGVGGGKGGQQRIAAMRKLVPCWRSLELHQALQQVDERMEANKAAQPWLPAQLRQRLEPWPVQYPPIDTATEPLPSCIERWMVSFEFARLFPESVANVSRNKIHPATTNSTILDPDQWGQHPPYEVYHSDHRHSGATGPFDGWKDRNMD